MGFADGVINGLCLSQRQQVAGASVRTLLLTLGDDDPGSWEIRTRNTVLDLRGATGVLDIGQHRRPQHQRRRREDRQGRHRRVSSSTRSAARSTASASRRATPSSTGSPAPPAGLPDPGPPHDAEARALRTARHGRLPRPRGADGDARHALTASPRAVARMRSRMPPRFPAPTVATAFAHPPRPERPLMPRDLLRRVLTRVAVVAGAGALAVGSESPRPPRPGPSPGAGPGQGPARCSPGTSAARKGSPSRPCPATRPDRLATDGLLADQLNPQLNAKMAGPSRRVQDVLRADGDAGGQEPRATTRGPRRSPSPRSSWRAA
ncbi:hypothetical protein STANM309S_02838 [Streptomyces tanashiensis]